MRLDLVNNQELVIACNPDKAGDFERAQRVAQAIQEATQSELIIVSEEEGEFVHLCSTNQSGNAEAWRIYYNEAKASTK